VLPRLQKWPEVDGQLTPYGTFTAHNKIAVCLDASWIFTKKGIAILSLQNIGSNGYSPERMKRSSVSMTYLI
jgi:hypothetical protein